MTGLREQHKRTTRRALEDAALRLFARDGYEPTSVGAIAAEAGVTERTYFRYFATKDEVLTPDREERQARLHEEVARAAEQGRTTMQVAATALVAIAPEYEAERATMLLRRRAATTSPVLRGRLYDVVHTWQRTLATALADAGFAVLESDVTAEAATALWQGSITRWLDAGTEPDPDRESDGTGTGTLGEHLAAAFAVLESAAS